MFDTFQEEVLCNDLVVCHMDQKDTPLVVVCHKDLLQDARATMKNIVNCLYYSLISQKH